MTARVDVRRRGATATDILARQAVRGMTWQDAALLWNWVLGRGKNVIPAHLGTTTALTAGTAYVYKFRVRPAYQAVERVWAVSMRCADSPTTVEIKVPSTGAAVAATAQVSRARVLPALFREILSAQSSAETELSIEIKPLGSNNLIVESIACWDIPRSVLATSGSDRGTDPQLLRPGQNISTTTAANMAAAAADDDEGRRVSLIQWAVPVTAGGATTTAFAYSTTATTYQNIWTTGVPGLARLLATADVTQTIRCKFLAWVTGGTGDVRLNSSVNGASSSVSISATTPTWSSAIDFAIDCTKLAAADGLQASAFDLIQAQAQKNTSGTIYVAAVSAWED